MRTMPPYRVQRIATAADHQAAHDIRDTVFVQGQGVPADIERDGLDGQCEHVLARLLDGTPIGTGRLAPDGRIGRMAVLEPWRGRGVGEALLRALLAAAREAGMTQVQLHAQLPAQAFYARNGFTAHGEVFEEAGIAHQAMTQVLGGVQTIVTREEAVAATASIIAGARRLVCIRCRALDPGVLDAPEVVEALRGFATGQPGSVVQLLLQDALAARQSAHGPLLVLLQRLPSVFALREADDPVDREFAGAFIASDGGGWYQRTLGHRVEGEAQLHGPGRARQLREAFGEVWERSRPATEWRALGL